MKLSEIKNEKAIEALIELVDPITEITSDVEVLGLMAKIQEHGAKQDLLKMIAKNHSKALIKIFAILDGEDPETYEVNLITIPKKLLEIINDPEVMQLFGLQSQTGDAMSSGSVLANANSEEM